MKDCLMGFLSENKKEIFVVYKGGIGLHRLMCLSLCQNATVLIKINAKWKEENLLSIYISLNLASFLR